MLTFTNQINECDEKLKLLSKLPGKAVIYENVAPSLKCSSLDDSGDESDNVYGDDERQTKGKHIKWKMDYEENQHGNDLYLFNSEVIFTQVKFVKIRGGEDIKIPCLRI